MTPELEAKLFEAYPELFANTKLSPQVSPMAFGIECGDGWFDLIDTACHEIDVHTKREKIEFRWDQIKEKFGGLRLYHSGGDEYTRGVAHMAESMSYLTCETCGNRGKPDRSGWIVTTCDSCKKKRDELKAT